MRGATISLRHISRRVINFNPRTPCGVRRGNYSASSCNSSFQSTHPMRGATKTHRTIYRRRAFQSTHPMRGATDEKSHRDLYVDISIHAPHAGCDPFVSFTRARSSLFQSTHPLRGATRRSRSRPLPFQISIHAPLAGCDLICYTHFPLL